MPTPLAGVLWWPLALSQLYTREAWRWAPMTPARSVPHPPGQSLRALLPLFPRAAACAAGVSNTVTTTQPSPLSLCRPAHCCVLLGRARPCRHSMPSKVLAGWAVSWLVYQPRAASAA